MVPNGCFKNATLFMRDAYENARERTRVPLRLIDTQIDRYLARHAASRAPAPVPGRPGSRFPDPAKANEATSNDKDHVMWHVRGISVVVDEGMSAHGPPYRYP